MPEPPAFLERFFDLGVCIEHAHAAKKLDRVEEMPARADGRVDIETVSLPGLKIVRAMTGRRVNGAGTGVERHVVAEDADRSARVKRMLKTDALELGAFHPRHGSSERSTHRF